MDPFRHPALCVLLAAVILHGAAPTIVPTTARCEIAPQKGGRCAEVTTARTPASPAETLREQLDIIRGALVTGRVAARH